MCIGLSRNRRNPSVGSRRWSIYPSWASGAPAPCGKTAGLPLGLGPCCHTAGHLKFPRVRKPQDFVGHRFIHRAQDSRFTAQLGYFDHLPGPSRLPTPNELQIAPRNPFPNLPRAWQAPFPHPRRGLRRVWRNPNAPGTAPMCSPRPRRARHSPDEPSTASAGAPFAAPTRPAQPQRARAGGNASSHPLKHLSRGMGHLSVIMKRHDTKDRMKP